MLENDRRRLFESLLTEQLHAMAWRYASRLAATREDAEDLLQEALVHAYRKLHQLREPEAFRPWLFSIIRSRGVNLQRRLPAGFAASLWFQRVLAQEQPHALAERLALALARLPAAQSELLALFYLDELSLAETGRVLGIAPLAVGQRLHRARQALRRVLENQLELGLAPRS
jgi:RNA polymerase sigma-70 factor (ECF subfamily)